MFPTVPAEVEPETTVRASRAHYSKRLERTARIRLLMCGRARRRKMLETSGNAAGCILYSGVVNCVHDCMIDEPCYALRFEMTSEGSGDRFGFLYLIST